MSTQTRDFSRIEYPVYEPKKVHNERSYSQSDELNHSEYSILPTQMLNKCSSVSASTSMRHTIENISDRLLLKFLLAFSQQTPNPMSPRVSHPKSKRSEGVRIRKLIRVGSNKFEKKGKGLSSEATEDEEIIPVNNKHILNANLTRKYQPKVFSDIAGHELTVLAISKAVEKMKIASLYLFHGPTGTGKTSTAKIFAMALNCESTTPKPCWNCRGCSRSLFIMELCSGSKADGFEKLKTLLENTSFARAIPGFKVLIIKQCHIFNQKDWDELLGMAERAYEFGVVFVIVTVSANTIPLNILSRCQKFSFPRLTTTEIMLKLAKIAANEGIRIEEEPLKMIAARAEGSLREAENLLDQLALLGSTITSSMVQRLVGLLPRNKLIDLLETAISGDAMKIMRYTKELIAMGVEPHLLVSQLVGLVTDVVSDDTVSASSSSSTRSTKYNMFLRRIQQLEKSESERLCNILKVLVEADKQLRSSTDQNTILMASLLDITSNSFSNRTSTGYAWQKKESYGYKSSETSEYQQNESIFLGRSNSRSHSISSISEQLDTYTNELLMSTDNIGKTQSSNITEDEKTILPTMNDMEIIWRKTLIGIQNGHVKEFLLQAKLASLTVSSGSIIIHLMFKKPEDKMAAQLSEITIRRVLQSTIGCDVTLNMSVEPVETGITGNNTVLLKSQSYKSSEKPQIQNLDEDFNNTGFEDIKHQSSPRDYSLSNNQRNKTFKDRTQWQGQNIYGTEKRGASTYLRNITPFFGSPIQKEDFDVSINSVRETYGREKSSNDPTYRCLSVSSIGQSDASVEPYSRDIFFDRDEERRGNGKKNRKFRKGFSQFVEKSDFPSRAISHRWNYFGGCRDVLCSRQTQ